MLDKNVLLILDRAFVDEDFRRQLEADLESTVKGMGFELSDEAIGELMAALDEGGGFATGLDQRLSQSGVSLNPAALLRQKTAGGKQTAEPGSQRVISVKYTARPSRQRRSINTDNVSDAMAISDDPLEADEIDIEVEQD